MHMAIELERPLGQMVITITGQQQNDNSYSPQNCNSNAIVGDVGGVSDRTRYLFIFHMLSNVWRIFIQPALFLLLCVEALHRDHRRSIRMIIIIYIPLNVELLQIILVIRTSPPICMSQAVGVGGWRWLVSGERALRMMVAHIIMGNKIFE